MHVLLQCIYWFYWQRGIDVNVVLVLILLLFYIFGISLKEHTLMMAFT